MGKKSEQTRKQSAKAAKQQPKLKTKPKTPPKEEEYPVYENDQDIPVFDPENMQANIINQKRKKKNKNKFQKEPVQEPPVEVEEEEVESPNIDDAGIEEELEDEDLVGDDEMQNYDQQSAEQGQQQAEQPLEEEHLDGADAQGHDEVAPGKEGKEISMSIINTKIQETLAILSNFSRLAAGKTRKHYITELKGYIRSYYDYNQQLIDHFLTFLNPNEMVQLIEANETQRPLTIRVNTLKTRRKELAQALIQRGVNLDPLAEWSKVGIKIYESRVPIGATPEYLAGHYMLQSASSLLPVMALDARPGERVLDMAAAPGGKTTYIAQIMKNSGVIVANDSKKERLRALQFNVQRLGISNTIVTNYDGRKLTHVMNNFDRVLLDAPCTGLGIISKDPSIKAEKLLIDIQKHSHLQKELILSAIDCCKPNGVIVYSTCSISPLENEEVVNYAIRKRFVKVVQLELEVGEPGLTKYIDKRYHPHLALTKRIYPHVVNMDGFYVAKLVKISNGEKKTDESEEVAPVPVEAEPEPEPVPEVKPKKKQNKLFSKSPEKIGKVEKVQQKQAELPKPAKVQKPQKIKKREEEDAKPAATEPKRVKKIKKVSTT